MVAVSLPTWSWGLHPLGRRADPGFWFAWSALARAESPFLRPEFFALERPLLAAGEPFVAAAFENGALAATLPLLRQGRTLQALRTDHAPCFDVVGDAAAIASLWRALAAERDWDTLVLSGVPAGSPLTVHLPDLALRDLCVTTVKTGARPPYLELPGHAGRLSAKLQQNLRRCRRKLGAFALERVTRPARAALDQLFALEASAWKGAAGSSILASDATRHFYLALARLAARRGELSIYFLRAGERRIAFLYALEHERRLSALKIGYHPSFGEYSPGHLLVAEVARDAEARGLADLDLGGHDDEWKRRWTSATREHVSLVVYRASVRGAASLVAHELVKPRLPERWTCSAVQLRAELGRARRQCQREDLVGEHTLFERLGRGVRRGLELRESAARVLAGAPRRAPLGEPSGFAPGQWVRVRRLEDVIATLDGGGRQRGLAFVPAQWGTCGQRYRVERPVRRIIDDAGVLRPVARTVLLEGVHCGIAHESLGCGRHCPLFYRDEWLEPAEAPAHAPAPPDPSASLFARVRPLAQIEATLDGERRREGVRFMAHMAAFAGRRLRVVELLPQVFELGRWVPPRGAVYVLEGAGCDGATPGEEGPCDRACALLWHGDWLVLE